jgi:small basic protein
MNYIPHLLICVASQLAIGIYMISLQHTSIPETSSALGTITAVILIGTVIPYALALLFRLFSIKAFQIAFVVLLYIALAFNLMGVYGFSMYST